MRGSGVWKGLRSRKGDWDLRGGQGYQRSRRVSEE